MAAGQSVALDMLHMVHVVFALAVFRGGDGELVAAMGPGKESAVEMLAGCHDGSGHDNGNVGGKRCWP